MNKQTPHIHTEEAIYSILFKASRLSDGVRCVNEDEWPTELLAKLIDQALHQQSNQIKEVKELADYVMNNVNFLKEEHRSKNLYDLINSLSSPKESK